MMAPVRGGAGGVAGTVVEVVVVVSTLVVVDGSVDVERVGGSVDVFEEMGLVVATGPVTSGAHPVVNTISMMSVGLDLILRGTSSLRWPQWLAAGAWSMDPSRNQVGMAPLPFISTIPCGTQRKRSLIS